MISVRCPHCHPNIRADDRYTGRLVACPGCKQQVKIPASAESPSASPVPSHPSSPSPVSASQPKPSANSQEDSFRTLKDGQEHSAPHDSSHTGVSGSGIILTGKCQYCQADIHADERQVGEVVHCPSCKKLVKFRPMALSPPNGNSSHSLSPTPVPTHETTQVSHEPEQASIDEEVLSWVPSSSSVPPANNGPIPPLKESSLPRPVTGTPSGSDMIMDEALQGTDKNSMRHESEAPRSSPVREKEVSRDVSQRVSALRQPVNALQGMIIIMLLLAGLGQPLVGWLKPLPKWEYTIAAPSDSQLETTMCDMGADGWELVSARRATGEHSAAYEMIFKRPSVTGVFGKRMASEIPDRSKATPDVGTSAVSAWYKKGYDLGMGSGKSARNGVGTFNPYPDYDFLRRTCHFGTDVVPEKGTDDYGEFSKGYEVGYRDAYSK